LLNIVEEKVNIDEVNLTGNCEFYRVVWAKPLLGLLLGFSSCQTSLFCVVISSPCGFSDHRLFINLAVVRNVLYNLSWFYELKEHSFFLIF